MDWPSTLTSPDCGTRIPFIHLRRVVFPEAFGPRSPQMEPLSTENSMSSRTVFPPYPKLREWTDRMDLLMLMIALYINFHLLLQKITLNNFFQRCS
jgi:hypothetical protein